MYESFFSFTEKPFSLTPNPRFLFLSKTHNEVYAHLIYGIEHRTGFIEVTGEVGTGKTTILRALLSHLDEDKYRVAFIFNPKLTAFELLRKINHEFGISDEGHFFMALVDSLNKFLLSENQAGRTPILVIDEAQNLSGEVLEQIRLLSNLETENDKLIQIVLVGQPELRKHLSDHSLRQLDQRIAVRYHLRSLNREETRSYILNRLKIAGRPEHKVFSPAALKKVFKASAGIPRKINLICDRALLTAYTEDRGIVSVRHVKQAVAELEGMGEGGFNERPLPWKSISLALIVCIGIVAGFTSFAPLKSWLTGESLQTPVVPSRVEAGSDVLEPVLPMVKASAVSDPDPPGSLVTSVNALFALWKVPQIDTVTNPDSLDLDQELTTRGFELVRLTGPFEDLRKYNVPVMLPLSEEQGGGYLAVLGRTSSGNWLVAPAYRGQATLTSAMLGALGMRMALVPWVDFADIGNVAVPGTRGENVRRLQYLLGLAGCVDVPTNGRYDARTISCVKSFQRDQKLVVDGLVGPRTLILLYQVAGAYDMPRLS